jgi:hypothetical protein
MAISIAIFILLMVTTDSFAASGAIEIPKPSRYIETFDIRGEEANYRFIAGEWSPDTIAAYIAAAEDAIRYVKDWFGYEYEKPLEITLYAGASNDPAWANALAITSGDKITLFWCMKYPPIAVVHEAVHALSMLAGEFSDIFLSDEGFGAFAGVPVYYFEEGLAEAIRILYNEERSPYCDLRSRNDSRAARIINEYIYLPFEHPYLYTYETSTSFVLYLLSQGTKDDFLEVRRDIGRINELYGKGLDSMVRGWKETVLARN